jgi:hypothetical protein
MAMMEVDRRGQDTATVVIAVGVGDINLALRKPSNGNRCNSTSNSSTNMISADCDEGGYRNTKSI